MPSLNNTHYLTIFGFAISLILTIGGGGPPFDFDLQEIWKRNGSFLTPSDLVLNLTSTVVQLFQGIFVLTQLLPAYRYSSFVTDEVRQFFFGAMVAQLMICASLVQEAPILATIFAALCVAAFVKVLLIQNADKTVVTCEEFWMLKFPISLSTGWAFATFLMVFNGIFIEYGAPLQALWTVIFLGIMIGVAGYTLKYSPLSPDYVIPALLGWCMIGMALGEHPEMEEGIFCTILSILTCLTGLGIVCGTIYVGHKVELASIKDIEGSSTMAQYEGGAMGPGTA